MRLAHLTLPLVLALAACSGSAAHGTELTRATPLGEATMSYTPAVDPTVADAVLGAMVAANYNFAAGLPEQLDRVDGRLTLRLCNDNEASIADLESDPEASGIPSYLRGLARVVSTAAGGEPVDIVMCEATLETPFYTLVWSPGS